MQGFESWVGIHVDGEAYFSCPRERLPSGFLDIDYLKTDRVLDTYYEQPVEILVFYNPHKTPHRKGVGIKAIKNKKCLTYKYI